MAATTITARPPAPAEIAHATAAAIPSELSARPVLGIFGVLIGAGLVTLTGRMLSLGLADLKGHVGISYDQGAWLDSAYNASVMFIGPFTSFSEACSDHAASFCSRQECLLRLAPSCR